MKHLPCIGLLVLLTGVSPAATHILPTPHYFEPLNRRIPTNICCATCGR